MDLPLVLILQEKILNKSFLKYRLDLLILERTCINKSMNNVITFNNMCNKKIYNDIEILLYRRECNNVFYSFFIQAISKFQNHL